METVFTAVLLALVLLFYFSGRGNKVNKWCAYAAFICWLGVAKEAVLFNLIPALETLSGNYSLSTAFAPVYSIQTWAVYSLATPTALIYSLYLYNLDQRSPRAMRIVKRLAYLPALALSFYFTPLSFRALQVDGLADGLHSPFWVTYSLYNFIYVAAYSYFLIAGSLRGTEPETRKQKYIAVTLSLPAVLYCYFAVFPIHTFGVGNQFKLWQGNLMLILLCVAVFIVMSFKTGVMGLKLKREIYRWDSDMAIVNKGAEYTGHMIKNQAAKMEWSIENLAEWFARHNQEAPEELAILSRSLSSFKDYAGRIKKLSDEVVLSEEICGLHHLLQNSVPARPSAAEIMIQPFDEVGLLCDKAHMGEVFTNIIINAVEAVSVSASGGGGQGKIEISCARGKGGRFYLIRFADNGAGIRSGDLKKVFTPYYTTKHDQKNFGLGLAYCKNVVQKHGGEIYADSSPGKGTAFTVALPSSRIVAPGQDEGQL